MKQIAALTFLLFTSIAHAGINKFNSDPVTVKFFSESPDLRLTLQSLDLTATPNEVEYRPNVGSPSGISLSYAGLFGFSYITEINEERVTDEKGRTSYDDYRFNFAFSQFLVSLKYLRYHGMFIENSSVIDSTLPADAPFIKRQDIRLSNVSAHFTWVFNSKEYSLAALLDQTVRQESSGGSWLAGVNLGQFNFSGEQALIPSNVQANFGSDATLLEGEFTTASATFGYGYNWVFSKNYYIGILIMTGVGHQIRRFRTESDGDIEESGRAQKFDARIGLGYIGDTFFIGAHTNGDTTSFDTNSIRIKPELLNFQVFLGFRF